jgi:hypothetical protein
VKFVIHHSKFLVRNSADPRSIAPGTRFVPLPITRTGGREEQFELGSHDGNAD